MRRNSLSHDTGYAGGPIGLPAGSSGMLALVENHDFGSNATSYTFSGLDGDTDELYLLVYKLIKNTASVMLTTVRPNGATTNQKSVHSYSGLIGGGAASGTGNSTTMEIGNNGNGSGSIEEGCLWLNAKSGVHRLGHKEWSQEDGTTTLLYASGAVLWTDTGTNITSIDVVADQANGIGAGSFARLYKLKKA